jgi:hypothetical protein
MPAVTRPFRRSRVAGRLPRHVCGVRAGSVVLVKVGGNVSGAEPQLLAQPQARHLPALYRVIKPALAHLPQPPQVVSIQQPHIRCRRDQDLVPLPGTSRCRDWCSGPWSSAQPAQVPHSGTSALAARPCSCSHRLISAIGASCRPITRDGRPSRPAPGGTPSTWAARDPRTAVRLGWPVSPPPPPALMIASSLGRPTYPDGDNCRS